VDPVETQYLERDGLQLAYQVIGNGPGEILFHAEMNVHPDLMWTDPHTHALYERIAPSCRFVVMQRRGVGLSDPMSTCPTVEQQAADIVAVMDAAGLRKPTLASSFSMCAAVALVAARNPERVRNLFLVQPLPTGVGAPTATEHGWPADAVDEIAARMRSAISDWGSGRTVQLWDGDLDTPYNRRLTGLMERCSVTPAAALAGFEFLIDLDLSDVFRAIRVPTRVVCVPNNVAPPSVIRHAAELIEGSEFYTLPPSPPGASLGEAWSPLFDMMAQMANDAPSAANPDRILGTVLFTDLVKSTEVLTRIGDAAYRDLRAAHEREVRLSVETYGGRLVNVIGDGTLSIFERASDAVHCAEAICAESDAQRVAVRAGVHSGELERTGMDITGMTVHVGARVAALAGPGEVLVSRTVKDLLLGSGMQFKERGTKALKGVPGKWDLYALAGRVPNATDAASNEFLATPSDRMALRIAQRAPRLARASVAFGNAWQRRRATAQ
jgi:class 3 adenylate cyclase/pimeloyl-ACP methyl ester carboxylesterase